MQPVLYSIGRYNVYSFGIFLALSFILSTFVIWKFAKEEFKEEEYLDAYFYTALVTLICARAVYIIRNFNDFQFNILSYFLVVETPGLSLLGGAIGGFLFLLFYSRKKKFNFLHLMDLLSVAGSLALVFIKIGQQLGGAAFGRETDFIIKVRVIGMPKFYHPVEFYEAFLYLLLFIFLLFLNRKLSGKKRQDGMVFSLFVMGLSVSVFTLEFLKVYRVYLYNLSFRQLLSLILFVITLAYILSRIEILKYFRKAKHEISKSSNG